MKKLTVLLITLFGLIGFLKAQDPQWIVYDTTNSGLELPENNRIQAITVENDSIIWIGNNYTYSGLIRFDGLDWTFFDSDSLFISNVGSIVIDELGSMWIGTHTASMGWGGGLFKYDGFSWTEFNNNNSGLICNAVNAIAIDDDGTKWIGCGQPEVCAGLFTFDGINWTEYTTNNSGLDDNFVNALEVDDDGVIWIGTYDGGLTSYDGQIWTTYNDTNSGLPVNLVTSIAIDTDGTKWIGTYHGGLASFKDGVWTVYNTTNSGIPANQISCISIESNGTKWIGTWKGLVSFNGADWIVYDTLNSEIVKNDVYSLAIDGNDTKWIGCNDDYRLSVFNENGIPVSVNENVLNKEKLKVYPNPTNSKLNVEFTSGINISYIEIINIQGMLVGHVKVGSNQKTIDIQELPIGLYIIRVHTGREIVSNKFIKQ